MSCFKMGTAAGFSRYYLPKGVVQFCLLRNSNITNDNFVLHHARYHIQHMYWLVLHLFCGVTILYKVDLTNSWKNLLRKNTCSSWCYFLYRPLQKIHLPSSTASSLEHSWCTGFNVSFVVSKFKHSKGKNNTSRPNIIRLTLD